MKNSVFYTLLTLGVSVTQAVPFPFSNDGGAGIVKFPVDREAGSSSNIRSFAQSSKFVNQTISTTNHFSYFFNVSVGTPAQQVRVQLDTGSSDTWFFQKGIGFPNDVSYQENASSTYQLVSHTYSAAYAGGDAVQGDWFKDKITIANYTIPSQLMALVKKASEATLPIGIIGVGRVELETSSKPATYPNIPVSLHDQGYINRIAYSLYLNNYSRGFNFTIHEFNHKGGNSMVARGCNFLLSKIDSDRTLQAKIRTERFKIQNTVPRECGRVSLVHVALDVLDWGPTSESIRNPWHETHQQKEWC